MLHYAEQLKQIITYFPIGGKINYYPEYLEDVDLETIILGYELNEKAIYARDHVRDLNGVLEFFLEETAETLTAADVASFAFIVPDTSELEKTLDYNSKAVVGRSGQFVRGNSITLVSASKSNGIPILDTAVLRRTILKDGYYHNYKVVTLDPKLDSLTTRENRQQARMEFSLPCTIFTPVDSLSGQTGTLIDCSELCVGFQLSDVSTDNKELSEGAVARLCIPMPELDRAFDLTGEIVAIRSNGSTVVELKSIYKLGKVQDLLLVDRLDLRAALVQCRHEQLTGKGSGGEHSSRLVG